MRGFAEADYEMTSAAFSPSDKHDERLMVSFSLHPRIDNEASSKEGRPIFKDTVYIMIIVPGDKDSIVHRPAYEMDFARFPKQYAAFKNKSESSVIGTPLKLVPWLSASQIKELDYFNVRTVEQLADVTDNLAAKFHGLQSLKQKAKDFLAAARDAAPMLEMRSQLEQRDTQIQAMQRQLAELAAKLDVKPEKDMPKKKGE